MARFIKEESEYFDIREIIKLEQCLQGGSNCFDAREVMNSLLVEARTHLGNKDFIKALKSLKDAYSQTLILKDEPCCRCAGLFHEVICNTAGNMVHELEKMNQGWFKKKRYSSELVTARALLAEIKK